MRPRINFRAGKLALAAKRTLVPESRAGEPKLRVCVLAACAFPANHGTPGSIRELVEATAERGHEVHVVTYHMGEDLPLRGVYVHRISDWTGERAITVGPTRRRPLYDLQMVFETARVMRRYDLDLMHAHGYEAALVAGCCRPLVRRPVLYSAHNSMIDELASYNFFRSRRFANSLAWTLDRVVPRIGNRCIPHSENLQRFLQERGLASRSEPVLNFGIDFSKRPQGDRAACRRRLGLGDQPVVLYSGVTDRFQRLDLLLEAMVGVAKVAADARLVILTNVPNANHEAEIRRRADALGIADRVTLHAPADMYEGLELLAAADVAVVPRPAAPGFPIKLLNYMAAERACAMYASSASGIVDGEHAVLANEDTAEALSAAIVALLLDESLREKVAAGGRAFVEERHDRRRAAAQLCAAYRRLLEPTKRWRDVSKRPEVRPVTGDAYETRRVSAHCTPAEEDIHAVA